MYGAECYVLTIYIRGTLRIFSDMQISVRFRHCDLLHTKPLDKSYCTLLLALPRTRVTICCYYSTNCHYAHIWQGSPQYLSSYMTDILRYT